MKPEEIKLREECATEACETLTENNITFANDESEVECINIISGLIVQVSELQSTIDQQNAEIEGFREHIKETFNSKESECESLRNNLTQVMNQKIEALNEELFNKTAEYDYVMNELEEAVFLRDKFKKQIDKNNTWFDVDSKTPENHNLVLVKLKNGATTIGRVYDDGEWGIFKFQNSGVVFQKPTHWMYLPS